MTNEAKLVRELPVGQGHGARQPASSSAADAATPLKLEFRKARLETIVEQLRKSAGLRIHVGSNVRAEHPIDLWHDQPVDPTEALSLFKRVLIGVGCTVIKKGPLFSVIRSEDLKKNWIPLPAVWPKDATPIAA